MKPATGAQLWSLRKVLLDKPEATLKKLADTGHTCIEPAGFDVEQNTLQGFKPAALKKLADDQGLKIASGHFQFNVEQAAVVSKCAAELGMKYVVRSFFRDEFEQTPDHYKQAAEALNRMGLVVSKWGLQLAYHNHAHEFTPIKGITPFDILLEQTDPALVVFQPDLGWLSYAGQNPLKYFQRFPGRFPVWHLRDIDPVTQKTTTVGEGAVDFISALNSRDLAGLQYCIVEMASDTEEPLDKILDSYKAIQNWL